MDIVSSFRNFILEFMDQQGREAYLEQVRRMTTEGKRSLLVDYADLLRYDPELAEELIFRPDEVLVDAEKALWEALRVQDADFAEKAGMVHVRIINSYQSTLVPMRAVRAEHIARLIAIDGIVTRATEIKPLLTQAWFRCLAEACGHEFVRFQEEGRYNPPVTCPNPECNRKGPFKLLTERSTFVDWQRITIQEKPEDLPPGQMPQSFSVVLRDDLVDSVRPGDRALVTGVLHSYPERMLKRGQLATYTRVLEGVACEKETEQYEKLEISPEDEENILELAKDPIIDKKIVQSIAPSIHGYEVVKEAIACLLFGGAGKETPDGMRIRGDVNILMVGDPGTGKSQILKNISGLAPRGLYTSGRGSSAAGLCVTGESGIFLSNGIHTISEIVENEFQHGEILQYNEEMHYKKNMGCDLRVFHSKNLKLEFQPIKRFWKIKSPRKLIRITSKTGRKLELTQETSVLSLDRNSGLVWKPARLLSPRERIAVARTYSIGSSKEVPSIYELIKDYPGKINLLNLSKAVQFLVEKIINKAGITKHALAKKLGIYEATLYRWLDESQPGTISLSKLQRLAQLANENILRFLPEDLHLEIKRGQTIVLQQKLNEDWFYIMGLIFGDGRISIDKRESSYGGVTIGLSNRENALLTEFQTFFANLGLKAKISAANSRRPSECRVWSKLIYHIFSKFGLCESPKSSHIKPNPEILSYSQNFLYAFLRGLFDADGWICIRKSGSSHIGFSSTSYSLVSFVQNALLTLGIVAYIRKRKPKTTTLADGGKIKGKHAKYELTFNNYSEFISFNESIGFSHPKKRESLQKYCQIKKNSHRNDDNIPGAMQILKEILNFYDYNAKEISGYKSAFSPSKFKKAMSRERLSTILNKLDLDWSKHRVKLPYHIRNHFYQEIQARLSEISILKHAKLSKSQLYEYFIREKRIPSIPVRVFDSLLAKTSDKMNQETKEYWSRFLDDIREQHKNQLGKYELLKRLCDSDIFWDEITKIEKIDSQNQFVYDLTIPQTHNFIVNGFVAHNTAAVMRDTESGEMSLEAGALVLADEGIACIDEFDKMRSEDRSAIHEALEQHTVSIAKAGIVATLNARASVLAAANPREGRWDPWKDPAYNINLPPTLLSRFDLIFPLQDLPDEVEDERKSEHILKIHQARSLETEPPLSMDLLKKYISYARQRPPPRLSADAIDRLQKFYLELRKRAVVTEKGAEPIPVPITPRQLEALVRLAEARARMELRDEVLPEDAVAAIRLLTATMEALAVDLETGVWDSDRATTGISTKTRSRQGRLMVIVDKLAAEYGTFSFEQILQRGQKEIPGLEESELIDFIEFLKREGKLYEPQTDQYRKPR